MRRTEAGIEAECDHCGKTIRATCGLELCGLVWCRKPNVKILPPATGGSTKNKDDE
jgi:hypothetical protein